MSTKQNNNSKLITAEIVAARFAETEEMHKQMRSRDSAIPPKSKTVKAIAVEANSSDLSHRTVIGSMPAYIT